jgi:Leucine-rich repeat (LRR) protein
MLFFTCAKSTVDISATAPHIPKDAVSLDWRLKLNHKTALYVAAAFSIIPMHIKFLNISHNTLGSLPGPELGNALVNIHPELESLDLGWNNFGAMPTPDILFAFTKLPKALISLALGGNELHTKKGDDFVKIFGMLPRTITSLGLMWNYLSELAPVDLITMLRVIPENIKSLNLTGNGFGKVIGTTLGHVFYALRDHSNIDYMDLSWNDLSNIPTDELVAILKNTPLTVKLLNLSNNNLGKKSAADIVKIKAAVPAHILVDWAENGITDDYGCALSPLLLLGLNGTKHTLAHTPALSHSPAHTEGRAAATC